MKNKKKLIPTLLICFIIGVFLYYGVTWKMQNDAWDRIDNDLKNGDMKVYPDKKDEL